eukprot:m.5928 g.5928  ORF g.5928 m.5928 type:complete len:92 (+) comp8066_c0_seq1:222-497(+)
MQLLRSADRFTRKTTSARMVVADEGSLLNISKALQSYLQRNPRKVKRELDTFQSLSTHQHHDLQARGRATNFQARRTSQMETRPQRFSWHH